MDNTYLERAKETIMERFRDKCSRVGHAITIPDLNHIHNNESNPKIADCMDDALKALANDGKIELRTDGIYALTQAGFDFIFDDSEADCLEQAKKIVMDWFRQRECRVNYPMLQRDIIDLRNNERNPKVADCLIKAMHELAGDGLLEITKDSPGNRYSLTQTGVDAIY
jgi:predicted transcriptional regulator